MQIFLLNQTLYAKNVHWNEYWGLYHIKGLTICIFIHIGNWNIKIKILPFTKACPPPRNDYYSILYLICKAIKMFLFLLINHDLKICNSFGSFFIYSCKLNFDNFYLDYFKPGCETFWNCKPQSNWFKFSLLRSRFANNTTNSTIKSEVGFTKSVTYLLGRGLNKQKLQRTHHMTFIYLKKELERKYNELCRVYAVFGFSNKSTYSWIIRKLFY